MNLPLELLNFVATFLKPRDMAKICLVCKQWKKQWTPFLYAHVVAKGFMLRREISRGRTDFDDAPDIAPSLKKNANLICSLSFARFEDQEFDCLMACISYPRIIDDTIPEKCPLSVTRAAGQLSRITLTNFKPTSHIVQVLLFEQPNLREIVLKPGIFNPDFARIIVGLFELLPKWKQLETFEYNCNRHFLEIPFKHVVKFLSSCPTLRHLVLLGLVFEEFNDFVRTDECQYHFPSLITLELSGLSWSYIPEMSGIHPALSCLLRHLPTLQRLSVHSQIDYEIVLTPTNQTWRYGLANNQALKTIEVIRAFETYNYDIPGMVNSAAAEALSSICSQSLTSIRLDYACQETSDEAFANLFRCCQNLRHISIRQSEISDVALEALAATQENLALLHPRPIGLQTLSLRYCYNISAAPLARILYCCQNISLLSISGCSLIALGLFTRPPTSDDRDRCATHSATATDSPSNGLWACTNKLKKLQLELKASRYKPDMLRSTDQTSVDDDQSAVHDGNDDSDEDSESNSDTSHITFDQEQNLNARIPDDFTDDEMSLIRRQLDALVRLEELRLDGEAMSYDLLMVPRSPHDHSSESSTSPHLSHQSEGEECITTQDGENPEVKRLQKREYRAIRPLSNGNLSSIRIMTDVYFPDSTGMYQRPSIPSSHETLKKKEIMEWWRTYANSLFEKGRMGSEYRPHFPRIYFRVYGPSEAFS